MAGEVVGGPGSLEQQELALENLHLEGGKVPDREDSTRSLISHQVTNIISGHQ